MVPLKFKNGVQFSKMRFNKAIGFTIGHERLEGDFELTLDIYLVFFAITIGRFTTQ